MTNPFDAILAYEEGALTNEQVVLLFTNLIGSDDIWRLPTLYLDIAGQVINQGLMRKTN